MKISKFSKKLTLNKKTIVNLDDGEMNHVKGGTFLTYTRKPCDTVISCEYSQCNSCESLTIPCG